MTVNVTIVKLDENVTVTRRARECDSCETDENVTVIRRCREYDGY